MKRLDTVLIRVFLACVFGMMALFLFVPEIGKAKNIYTVPGVWGHVAKGLSTVAFSVAIASMAFGYTRRRRLANSPWPAVALRQSRYHSKRSPEGEFVVVIEDESDSWIFMEDGSPIAALRQSGRSGSTLKFYDDELEIISWKFHTGGVLMDETTELAVGKKTLWTGRIEIHAEHRIYRIRPRFVDLIGRKYYVMLDGREVGQYCKGRGNRWTVQGIRDMELHLAVFTFWLINQTIARES